MSPSTSRIAKQRGVALITAVLMVALATVLAVNIAFRGYLDQRRALTTLAFDQGYQLALGAEAWAADTLAEDFKKNPRFTHLAQKWATPIPPIPVDGGGQIQGELEDMAGRFNLNNLAETDKKRLDGYVKQFKNLLILIQLEPEWADKLVDWLDSDTNTYLDGAEDDAYSSEKPPYLVANQTITRTSELLALKGFGLERFRRLEPFVSALPPGTPINLCTASGVVLDSFGSALRQFSIDPKFLLRQRTDSCFPQQGELKASLSTSGKDEQERISDPTVTSTTSQYFRARTVVTLGTYEFTLYSHLQRSQNGEFTAAALRSFGTD